MTFLAIVHSPVLRPGARLCIADLAQSVEKPPEPLSRGADVSLRFGTCCPDLAVGAVDTCDAQTEEAVLRVAESRWAIRRSHSGEIAIPGLKAESWFVVDRVSQA